MLFNSSTAACKSKTEHSPPGVNWRHSFMKLKTIYLSLYASGGTRTTISLISLVKSLIPRNPGTFISTVRTLPSLLGDWMTFRTTTVPGFTFGWLDWHLCQIFKWWEKLTFPLVPESIGKMLDLTPLVLIEIRSNKVAGRGWERDDLLCEENSWGEYKWVSRICQHWNEGLCICYGRHLRHESDKKLVHKFCGFELNDYRVKNFLSQTHYPFPWGGIKGRWTSLSQQVISVCCIVYVWGYLEFSAHTNEIGATIWMDLSALMKLEVSRDSITSIWTALMLKHVKMAAHLLFWVTPPLVHHVEKLQGPNTSKATFVNGSLVERGSARRFKNFWMLMGALNLLHLTQWWKTELTFFLPLTIHQPAAQTAPSVKS